MKQLILVLILVLACLPVGTVMLVSCVQTPEKQLTESPPLQSEPDKPEVSVQEKQPIESPPLPSESDKPEIFLQLGHSRSVSSIAFSPDGKYALSGSHDKTLKLWEIATGREIRTFKGHFDPVTSVAFSPDGRYALSGSEDKTMKLWEMASGKEIRTFRGHAGWVRSVTFSPDGKYALSGSKTLKLWEVTTGKEIRTFKGHSDYTYSVALSPDGKYALSYSRDKTLTLWEVTTGEEIRTFKSHSGFVLSVAFSPDGKYAVSGSVDGALKLWEIPTCKEIRTFEVRPHEGHGGAINSVAFSPDGKYILFYCGISLRLTEVATGREVLRFKGDVYDCSITSVVFSPNGQYALSGTRSGRLGLWDIATGKVIRSFEGRSAVVHSVVFSPDGRYVLAGDFDKKAELWEISTGKRIKTFKVNRRGVFSVAFSPDGRYALLGCYRTLMLWDVEKGKEIKVFEGYSNDVTSVAFSPNGRYALSGGAYSYTLDLWEIDTWKKIRMFKGHSNHITSVAFSPDGKYALSGSYDDTIKLWDVTTGKEIRTFKGHSSLVESITFSPNGKYILSGSLDKTLKLWGIATGKEIKTFKGHSGTVRSVTFTPDGKYALSGSKDGTMRWWEIKTGKEIAQMAAFKDDNWICITPEGYFNASEEGAKYLNVSIGMNVYSMDPFFERFYNPTVVAQVLSGQKIELAENIQKGFKTPPEVTIISPKSGKVFNKEEIEIVVQAKNTGGGISEIRLYHNGSAIGEGRRGIKIVEAEPSISKKTYRVTLINGDNTFRAIGFSKDWTESNPYELIVRLTAPAKEVALHLLVVGINKYKNSGLNLNFAEPDARAIKDFFIRKGKTLFKEVNIVELYNESATRENILTELSRLQTQPQDVVIIYLAGHGMNLEDQWYFIPYEVIYPERDEEVKAKGITSSELGKKISNITALKKLVLIDACKSGKVLLAFARGLEDRRVLAQLARATGVHIIAASSQHQIAAEVKELGHGVFTYTLLEGLKGKARLIGNKVTVRGLLTYVEERLPEISKKYRREAQFPVSVSRGMDFPLILGNDK